MPCKAEIFNESGIELADLIKLANEFLPHAESVMGFSEPVAISLLSDEENSINPLGKTAYYDPGEMAISIFVDGRHPKDIMRSMSHELVHHTQNCNGMFDDIGEMSAGYAQEDDHLREMEREAYELGNMCFRDWEDDYKKKQEWELNEGIGDFAANAYDRVMQGVKNIPGNVAKIPGGVKKGFKGWAQAAKPGANWDRGTFGMGAVGSEKTQPHFTDDKSVKSSANAGTGPHWARRPDPLHDPDLADLIRSKRPGGEQTQTKNSDPKPEDFAVGKLSENSKTVMGLETGASEQPKSQEEEKRFPNNIKGWISWIFLHDDADVKKAFYSALYEDELSSQIKMDIYHKYAKVIDGRAKQTAADGPAQQELPLSDYEGSDTEAGQADLFRGAAPIRGGEGGGTPRPSAGEESTPITPSAPSSWATTGLPPFSDSDSSSTSAPITAPAGSGMQADVEAEGEPDVEDYWKSEGDVPTGLKWVLGEAERISNKYPDVQIDGTRLAAYIAKFDRREWPEGSIGVDDYTGTLQAFQESARPYPSFQQEMGDYEDEVYSTAQDKAAAATAASQAEEAARQNQAGTTNWDPTSKAHTSQMAYRQADLEDRQEPEIPLIQNFNKFQQDMRQRQIVTGGAGGNEAAAILELARILSQHPNIDLTQGMDVWQPPAPDMAEGLSFEEELRIRSAVQKAIKVISERKRKEWKEKNLTKKEVVRFSEIAGIGNLIKEGNWLTDNAWIQDQMAGAMDYIPFVDGPSDTHDSYSDAYRDDYTTSVASERADDMGHAGVTPEDQAAAERYTPNFLPDDLAIDVPAWAPNRLEYGLEDAFTYGASALRGADAGIPGLVFDTANPFSSYDSAMANITGDKNFQIDDQMAREYSRGAIHDRRTANARYVGRHQGAIADTQTRMSSYAVPRDENDRTYRDYTPAELSPYRAYLTLDNEERLSDRGFRAPFPDSPEQGKFRIYDSEILPAQQAALAQSQADQQYVTQVGAEGVYTIQDRYEDMTYRGYNPDNPYEMALNFTKTMTGLDALQHYGVEPALETIEAGGLGLIDYLPGDLYPEYMAGQDNASMTDWFLGLGGLNTITPGYPGYLDPTRAERGIEGLDGLRRESPGLVPTDPDWNVSAGDGSIIPTYLGDRHELTPDEIARFGPSVAGSETYITPPDIKTEIQAISNLEHDHDSFGDGPNGWRVRRQGQCLTTAVGGFTTGTETKSFVGQTLGGPMAFSYSSPSFGADENSTRVCGDRNVMSHMISMETDAAWVNNSNVGANRFRQWLDERGSITGDALSSELRDRLVDSDLKFNQVRDAFGTQAMRDEDIYTFFESSSAAWRGAESEDSQLLNTVLGGYMTVEEMGTDNAERLRLLLEGIDYEDPTNIDAAFNLLNIPEGTYRDNLSEHPNGVADVLTDMLWSQITVPAQSAEELTDQLVVIALRGNPNGSFSESMAQRLREGGAGDNISAEYLNNTDSLELIETTVTYNGESMPLIEAGLRVMEENTAAFAALDETPETPGAVDLGVLDGPGGRMQGDRAEQYQRNVLLRRGQAMTVLSSRVMDPTSTRSWASPSVETMATVEHVYQANRFLQNRSERARELFVEYGGDPANIGADAGAVDASGRAVLSRGQGGGVSSQNLEIMTKACSAAAGEYGATHMESVGCSLVEDGDLRGFKFYNNDIIEQTNWEETSIEAQYLAFLTDTGHGLADDYEQLVIDRSGRNHSMLAGNFWSRSAGTWTVGENIDRVFYDPLSGTDQWAASPGLGAQQIYGDGFEYLKLFQVRNGNNITVHQRWSDALGTNPNADLNSIFAAGQGGEEQRTKILNFVFSNNRSFKEGGRTPIVGGAEEPLPDSIYEIITTLGNPGIPLEAIDGDPSNGWQGRTEVSADDLASWHADARTVALQRLVAAGLLTAEDLQTLPQGLHSGVDTDGDGRIDISGTGTGTWVNGNQPEEQFYTGPAAFTNWWITTMEAKATAGDEGARTALDEFTTSYQIVERLATTATIKSNLSLSFSDYDEMKKHDHPDEYGARYDNRGQFDYWDMASDAATDAYETLYSGGFDSDRGHLDYPSRETLNAASLYEYWVLPEHGGTATNETRRWMLRYAPEIVYSYMSSQTQRLSEVERGLQLGDPNYNQRSELEQRQADVWGWGEDSALTSNPAAEMLRLYTDIMDVEVRDVGIDTISPVGATVDTSPEPGGSGAARQVRADGIANIGSQTEQEETATEATGVASFPGGVSVMARALPNGSRGMRIPVNGNMVRVGNYSPQQNTIYLTDINTWQIDGFGGNITWPNAQDKSYAQQALDARALQSTIQTIRDQSAFDGRPNPFGGNEPTVMNSQGQQIWPPTEQMREHRLIKEQLIKAFSNKKIDLPRERLTEIIRRQVMIHLRGAK